MPSRQQTARAAHTHTQTERTLDALFSPASASASCLFVLLMSIIVREDGKSVCEEEEVGRRKAAPWYEGPGSTGPSVSFIEPQHR